MISTYFIIKDLDIVEMRLKPLIKYISASNFIKDRSDKQWD
jgi:hypothetical protein